ncbi:hypothetical protein EUTSA_v10011263mg [Eutrema salsugineum]|uniref:Aminotransferase-like plant mobile domain-containing protein n=1 Tax=Eutrema salsugineum TaxID=72664 RepID=V4KSN8_EUTSA|nr:uncharacterized protein LOC18010995 [Eutrema salsugineum]ESQ30393.1 hypothetical protein EUTSA_v10011263mg [Eutrema salsugineum]
MANALSSLSQHTEKSLVEEREEVMVSEKGHSLRKTQFLKPFTTSIDGSGVAELPRQRLSVSSSRESLWSFSGFWFADRHFVSWFRKMEPLHGPIWEKAGIFEAIKASTYNISKNESLILSVAEKWCPETKSFVFPWGEATITLEDVMVLLRFSVLGSPVFAPLESSEMRDSVEKLEKVWHEHVRTDDRRVYETPWFLSFFGRGDQLEHEAFLALWLSFFVFPGACRRSISKRVFPVAVRLARGERIALAPAVLASIYRDLGRISGLATQRRDCKVNLKSLFKLVQVWTWERFKNTRPKPREIPKGEPRIAQWQQRSENMTWRFDDFDWRPYTKPLKNWNPLRFYVDEAMWVTVNDCLDDEFASIARCVRVSQLAGDGFVEDYYPNRVAMQFGLAQDLPALVTRHSNLTEKEAWDDYNKSLDGLKLYMPSLLARGSVTARYKSWWLRSVSEFLSSEEVQKQPTKTLNARNTFYDDDDDDDDDLDVSPKVLPLSQVVQKLEEGFPIKRKRSRMRRLAKKCKNNLVSSGWKMNKTSEDLTNKRSNYQPVQMKRAHEDGDQISMDDEDDNMTIARRISSRKTYYSDAENTEGDAIEPLGKRKRKFQVVDSDDSGPCQKLASVKLEQRSEEEDETARKAQKLRPICNDEVDVNGKSAQKKSMIDDGTKKAYCWLHEYEEKKRCNEKRKEGICERLKQRKIAIREKELELEARIVKMEKTLAEIRGWNYRGNQIINEVSA